MIQMAVYDPGMSVIGYVKLDCSWHDAGYISCSLVVQGLPAPLTYLVRKP